MKKTLLLFAACAAASLAMSAAMASAGFHVEPVHAMAFAVTSLATFRLVMPVIEHVAAHVKRALFTALQHPAGRSPAVALIAAKARMLRTISRKQITVTGSWRMCPSA